jgi:hypothetical protein
MKIYVALANSEHQCRFLEEALESAVFFLFFSSSILSFFFSLPICVHKETG